MNTGPITQNAPNIAQRDLRLAILSPLELEALIEEYRHNLTFSSQIIVRAARQILGVKRAMGER